MSRQIKELEAKVTTQQKKVAQMLSDNEFGLLSEDGKKLSMQQLCDMAGIARSTLYLWKKESFDFVELENAYSEHMLTAHRSEVYGLLVKGMRGHNGIPSSKMIELYLKHYGLLTDRSVVTEEREVSRPRKTDAEIAREIDQLNKLVNGEG